MYVLKTLNDFVYLSSHILNMKCQQQHQVATMKKYTEVDFTLSYNWQEPKKKHFLNVFVCFL